jgi:hypothetical protein
MITINRREALDLGLNVEKPTAEFYKIISAVYHSFSGELKLLEPYTPQAAAQAGVFDALNNYSERRGLVESTEGGCFGYLSEGSITRVQIPGPSGIQDGFRDDRSFEGWKKIS